jgi:hypothetical protein
MVLRLTVFLWIRLGLLMPRPRQHDRSSNFMGVSVDIRLETRSSRRTTVETTARDASASEAVTIWVAFADLQCRSTQPTTSM